MSHGHPLLVGLKSVRDDAFTTLAAAIAPTRPGQGARFMGIQAALPVAHGAVELRGAGLAWLAGA